MSSFASRQRQRDEAKVYIWPPSPTNIHPEIPIVDTLKRPRDSHKKKKHKKKKHSPLETVQPKHSDDDDVFGPMPAQDEFKVADHALASSFYTGEGSAIAALAESGKRIPRRGEIGFSGDQISNFEKLGYVMSMSRHATLNALRVRLDTQISEDKQAKLIASQQERQKKEAETIAMFKEMAANKFSPETKQI